MCLLPLNGVVPHSATDLAFILFPWSSHPHAARSGWIQRSVKRTEACGAGSTDSIPLGEVPWLYMDFSPRGQTEDLFKGHPVRAPPDFPTCGRRLWIALRPKMILSKFRNQEPPRREVREVVAEAGQWMQGVESWPERRNPSGRIIFLDRIIDEPKETDLTGRFDR